MSDRVFKEADDGGLEFVGDFDALYRDERDPWGQSATGGDMQAYYHRSRQNIVDALFLHDARGRGLEVGCGHGHAVKELWKRAPVHQWVGLDVSAVAIARARELYPNIEFQVGDIAKPLLPLDRHSFDVVVLNQVLWYVLDRIDIAMTSCGMLLRDGGLLMVSQAFLKGRQRYGADIAEGFAGAVKLFMDRYPWLRLIDARHDDSGRLAHNDGLLVFRKDG